MPISPSARAPENRKLTTEQDLIEANRDAMSTDGTRLDDIRTGQGYDVHAFEDGDAVMAGNAGMDAMNGGAGEDTMWGGSGKDALRGGDGNDWMDGGSEDDFMAGQRGHDELSDQDYCHQDKCVQEVFQPGRPRPSRAEIIQCPW